ncbi:type I secretion system permease/ATPase [Microbulbifer sp. A4B17]|uniref:type I secretion system permease/ATPase n=1 Tax=Microbulbifer sp. A4B17 TaxID=359370 RepID=UPI000D52B508|nr:type I secretion system permease/ATPase [Microbulbifer sp. A4B17]AWF82131.1 type I secretion system permease/ATPase [Microbulbifer sp. A4B17]
MEVVVERESCLSCLSVVARFNQLAVNPEKLQREFPVGNLEAHDVIKAAAFLGLKAKSHRYPCEKLESLPFPVMLVDSAGTCTILAGIRDGKALLQKVGQKSPIMISEEELPFDENKRLLIFLFRKKGILSSVERKFDISWFIPSILKYKKLLGQVLLASFFIQLFALITPLFFQVVVDKVLVHQGLTTLDVLALGFLVVCVFDVILNGLRTYLFSHTSNRIDVVLGSRLFNHLLRLPIAYFQNRRVGDTVARVRELDSIRQFITGSALTLCVDLFFTLVFFAVMFLYSPTLTWIVLGSLPLYVLLSIIITPILRNRLHEKFKLGAENQSFLVEACNGVETLKSMAVEPQMQRRWEEQLAGYVNASFRALNLGNVASQCASLINKLVTVGILWVGAHLVIAGELSVGMLIAFNMIAGRVSQPILKLVQLWQDFQQAGISIKRLGDILNTPTEAGHDPNRTTLPAIRGEIRFEHVKFRYGPDRPLVIDGIQLSIRPGEIMGIVGKSGSGKSTLTKLVQRLYVPEAGRVLVDGVDLALVDPAWLRQKVGVVLQESFLLNRTVRDNIALADPGAPMEKVVAAAKQAGAYDFILELPEGFDTVVGEQGSSLSGGQKQRIAIARALMADPRILIFDEATSALDYESEAIVQANMRQICQGRTVLIIAHRLSAVRDANRIVVMEKGRIVEQGSPKQLMQKKGHFARLNAMQSNLREVI